jgi:hypothetical protein
MSSHTISLSLIRVGWMMPQAVIVFASLNGRISWHEKGVVGSSCLHYVDNLAEEK